MYYLFVNSMFPVLIYDKYVDKFCKILMIVNGNKHLQANKKRYESLLLKV